MNIIFIAPPAAGKGTQSTLLEQKHDYIHISTGDLLREEIKQKTEFGTQIEQIISKGELVSDEIITKLLKNQLIKIKDSNFILDGYPRNIAQAHKLDELFSELQITNYCVIHLNLDEDIAIKRALGRVVCSKCGASYNTYFENLKPKENGICDKCHNELVQRTDDQEETIRNRFKTYYETTKPLLDYYDKKNKLHQVDANTTTEEIFASIEKILKSEDVDN